MTRFSRYWMFLGLFFGCLFSVSAQYGKPTEVVDFVWIANGSEIREIGGVPRIDVRGSSLSLKIKFKNNSGTETQTIPIKYIWYEYIAPRPIITDIFRANEGKTKTYKIDNQGFYYGNTTKESINQGMWVVRILYQNKPLIYQGKIFQPRVIVR